jgi:hypothetical protein
MSVFRFQDRFASKVVPDLDDRFLLSDSADDGALKVVKWSTFLAALGGSGGGGYLGQFATVADLLASGAKEGQWCILGSGTKRVAFCIAEPSTAADAWVVAGVDGANTPPVVTSSASVGAYVGDAFAHQLTSPGTVLEWGAVGLPDGLSLDSGSGLISGVVDVHGRWDVAVSAKNFGGSASQSLTVASGGLLSAFSGTEAAYALTQLYATYHGPLCTIRRVSDGAEVAWSHGVDGELNAAAIEAWLAGSGAELAVLNDQSGFGRHCVWDANRPVVATSGVLVRRNGRLAWRGTAGATLNAFPVLVSESGQMSMTVASDPVGVANVNFVMAIRSSSDWRSYLGLYSMTSSCGWVRMGNTNASVALDTVRSASGMEVLSIDGDALMWRCRRNQSLLLEAHGAASVPWSSNASVNLYPMNGGVWSFNYTSDTYTYPGMVGLMVFHRRAFSTDERSALNAVVQGYFGIV